jgi:hypothetical protein
MGEGNVKMVTVAGRYGDDDEIDAAAEKVRAQPKTVTRDLAAREASTKSPGREWASHHAATGRLMRDDSPPSPAILRAMADRKARDAQREAEVAAERERVNLRYRDVDARLDALFDETIALRKTEIARTTAVCAQCGTSFHRKRSTGRYCTDACQQQAYRDRVTLRAA